MTHPKCLKPSTFWPAVRKNKNCEKSLQRYTINSLFKRKGRQQGWLQKLPGHITFLYRWKVTSCIALCPGGEGRDLWGRVGGGRFGPAVRRWVCKPIDCGFKRRSGSLFFLFFWTVVNYGHSLTLPSTANDVGLIRISDHRCAEVMYKVQHKFLPSPPTLQLPGIWCCLYYKNTAEQRGWTK